MSSQPPSLSKITSNSKQTPSISVPSPGISQTQAFFTNNPSASRSGISSNRTAPAPRNNQAAKPKQKSTKKPRYGGWEDADTMPVSTGRRGQQSITHLMNFNLPPRHYETHHFRHGGRRGERRNPTWGLGSGYHSVDKARYIHANYRFIVDPRGNYRDQAEDADLHLDWNNVLQVIASSKTQAASCPICLGDPVAPRMAKCGHIFCLPCLIRYMHSEDNAAPPEKRARWKKCPICWDSIYITETRPVRWYVGQEGDAPREGGDVVLRLVKREAWSTLAMPRESAEPLAKGDDVPWYLAAEVMDYARVMKGSEEYMEQQYDEALAAVKLIEKEDELMFGEDAEWTGRAKRMLNEAKEKVKGIGNPPAQPTKPEPKPDRAPIQFNEDDRGVPEMYLHKQAQAFSQPQDNEPSAVRDTAPTTTQDSNYIPRTIAEMHARQTERPQPDEYFFYHALQHYYLPPLDIRILKKAFGSYNNFPSSILPRVERVSSGHVVDDDLRKRVKYLAHLPYGCEVGFLECDWIDTVSPEILKDFEHQIQRRRQRNEEKDAREEKDRVRIEKASEKEFASIRRKRPSISHDFFSAEQLPALSGSVAESGEEGASASPPWANRTTSAFASLASPSTSPNTHRTVWGTAAVAQASPDFDAKLPHDREFERDDGWLQGWERDLLASNESELVAQAEQMSLAEGAAGSSVVKGGKVAGGGGKKNKKGKKITLMSTTNRRAA